MVKYQVYVLHSERFPDRYYTGYTTDFPARLLCHNGKMSGPLCPEFISTQLHRAALLSREPPEMVWTTLAHHIDVEFLRYSFRSIRKSGAVGVDGVTASEYAANIEENLQSLRDRFREGTYRPPPVRRVHIPKGRNQTRPIGIPTLEDKILQGGWVIGKWINAGVFDDGMTHRSQRGSPQGGVISPLLSNIYLHHVLDLWFEGEVRPRMQGRARMVRYASD